MSIIFLSCCSPSGKDLSLPPREYQEMGFPDHSVVWSYEDYKEACIVLNNIKAIKPFSLPRKKSSRSGEIFYRMIDPVNLSFLQADSLTLKEKAYMIQKYIDIQGCLVTAYTDLDNKAQYYNRELIDLYIYGLIIAQDMLDLGQLINESTDSASIDIQYAFPSIQHMYLAMVLTILENQKKSYFFEESDLVRLSDFLYESITINKEWMNEPAKVRLRESLGNIINGPPPEAIKKKYSMLIGKL